MLVIKYFMLFLVLVACTLIGRFLSKKYIYRLNELEEMKNALNMFATKIKFTYEPIPSIFMEIANKIQRNIGQVFERAASRMREESAGGAWIHALEEVECNFTKEDKEVLKNLSRLLGQTDLEGQISEIEVVNQFLTSQLENAGEERRKNEKMYRTLGIITGLTIAIILI